MPAASSRPSAFARARPAGSKPGRPSCRTGASDTLRGDVGNEAQVAGIGLLDRELVEQPRHLLDDPFDARANRIVVLAVGVIVRHHRPAQIDHLPRGDRCEKLPIQRLEPKVPALEFFAAHLTVRTIRIVLDHLRPGRGRHRVSLGAEHGSGALEAAERAADFVERQPGCVRERPLGRDLLHRERTEDGKIGLGQVMGRHAASGRQRVNRL